MNRESIMIQWDMYRKRIAEGDKSSGPRDWFESFLDEIEQLEAENKELLRLAQFFRDWKYISNMQKQVERESNWKKLKVLESKDG